MSLRSYEDARGESTLHADVVVVGTGPGGAAIGRVLAQAGRSVVFVEEGPARPVFQRNMAHTMQYHMFESGVTTALGDCAVTIAAGRGVGGGSLINSAICWRTPDYVLESWEELLQTDRFSSREMTPVFDELWQLLRIGRTGERIAGENNKLIVRGARALGLEADLLERNTPTCAGCGVCNFGCPTGGKASVDTNLIPLARAAGAIVQADSRVTEVLVRQGRAAGVRAVVRHTDTRQETGELTVFAKQVVISAGAMGTPRLLLQAGLGDRLGPAVGQGLHLHPGNAVLGLCDDKVELWKGATQGAYFVDPELPGVLPHTLSLPPGALLLAMGGSGRVAKDHMAILDRMCGCVVMISDKGEGSVGVKSTGHADVRYWWDQADVVKMRKGLVRTAEVLLAGGAKKLLIPVIGGGWVDGLDEARAVIATAEVTDYRAMYAAHPMATCRMGLDPVTSVISPTGEAHGLEGLYVADSSIFPTALGVNPQITTMALATLIGRQMVASA